MGVTLIKVVRNHDAIILFTQNLLLGFRVNYILIEQLEK